MPDSANVNQFGLHCIQPGGGCDYGGGINGNMTSLTLAQCQAWGVQYGYNTIGMEGTYACVGCFSCNYKFSGACAGNSCNDMYTAVYPKTSHTAVQPVSAAPSPASAAGYTVNTFNSVNFSPSNMDITNSGAAGYISAKQWFFIQPSGMNGNACTAQPQCVAFNSGDGSVTINDSFFCSWATQGFNRGISQGVAFGGGAYFEAVYKWNGDTTIYTGAPSPFGGVQAQWEGFPSFWTNSIDFYVQNYTYGNVTRYVEVDIFESPYGISYHDWSQNPQNSNINGITATSQYQNYVAGLNFSTYNTYGMLWIPATPTSVGSLTPYLNGVQIHSPTTWTYYNCTSGFQNDYVGNPSYSPLSIMDCQHHGIMINTGSSSYMTVKSVNVWQNTFANNLYYGNS